MASVVGQGLAVWKLHVKKFAPLKESFLCEMFTCILCLMPTTHIREEDSTKQWVLTLLYGFAK